MAARSPSEISPTRFERINTVFSEALERAPETRPAFLAESCGDDQELKREVESLLAALDRSGARWESPILGVNIAEVSSGRSDDHVVDPVSRVGSTVGQYRLVRLMAQGGMGAVYEGQRADESFTKRVAVKFLRRGAGSEQAVQRFRHERAILATLEHRNIAALIDGGVLADGQPYFVMEFVEGHPITDYCDQRRLSVRERLHLVRQVCRAVQHAHERLVIHRDLKPSNILVTDDGTVKLLDFGIAKLLSAAPATDGVPVTQGHERAMTLEYASPEQVRATAVSTATDVYSLGIVVYELVAGRRPFDFGGASLHEITRSICEVDPRPPSEVADEGAVAPRAVGSLRTLRRQLAGDIDAILLMALRKEPARRYGSADRLSADIRRHLDGRPVAAERDRLSYRFGKFVSRHRWETAGALLLLASLAGGAITTAREAARADARYRDGRRLANTLIADVHDAIADLPGATAARARLLRPALEYLDRTASDAGDDPELDRELVFAYQRIGDVQGNPTNANLGDIAAARESYRKGLSIAERLVTRTPVEEPSLRALALVSERLADVTSPDGEVSEAVAYQRRALDVYAQIAARWPRADAIHAHAVARLKLGDLLGHPAFRNLGDTAAAMAQYRVALGELEAGAFGETDLYRNRRYRALLFERMGRIAQDGGDSAAVGLLTRSLHLRDSLVAERPASVDAQRDVAITHFLICALHLRDGAIDKARRSCDESYTIRERLYVADTDNAQLVRGMALINRRFAEIELAAGNRARAVSHLRASAGFYATLRDRGAMTGGDRADAAAVAALIDGHAPPADPPGRG
ncbi:MAG: protein kinase domain-containing protein [Gemmatimonadota bacterium]